MLAREHPRLWTATAGREQATGTPEPEPEGRDAEGRRESSTIGENDGASD